MEPADKQYYRPLFGVIRMPEINAVEIEESMGENG